MSLSIGVVYRTRATPSRLWLAVGALELIALRAGRVERRLLTPREALLDHGGALLVSVGDLSVEELLRSWGATASELDAAVRAALFASAAARPASAAAPGTCTLCGVPIRPDPVIRRCRACRAHGRAGVR